MEEKLPPARRIEEYRTPKNNITAASEETRQRYFIIYEDYIRNFKTELQIAKEYGYTPSHVCRIIKWCTQQFGQVTKKQRFREMFDRLAKSLQRLEKMYRNEEATGRKIQVMGEMRRTMKLLAQVEGLLVQAPKVDNSDRRKVTYVSGVNRRTEGEEGAGDGGQ